MSDKLPINRVRQGGPLSPEIFTAVVEEVLKKADICEGINVDGETLTNLRFVDDVARISTIKRKQIEKHLNSLNSESLEVCPKIHKGKTKDTTNHADGKDILINKENNEQVTEFKYLGQTTRQRHCKRINPCQDQSSVELFWKKIGKYSKVKKTPHITQKKKKKVMDQCVLSTMAYGCRTWSLNKQLANKLRTAQRAMERNMLNLKLQGKIPCAEIRKRTKIIGIIEYTLKQKWRWAGHIARMKMDQALHRAATKEDIKGATK